MNSLALRPLALLFPWIAALSCSASLDEPSPERVGMAEAALELPRLGYFAPVWQAKGGPGSGSLAQKGLASQNSLPDGILSRPEYVEQLRALRAAPLDAAAIVGVPGVTLYDEQWLRLMQYTVHCALPGNETIVVPDLDGGADIILYGNLGLAPEWQSGVLEVDGQRWVTACLLAHANNFGHRVNILLVGNHPALQATAPADSMPFQEAAFYGNLFPPPNIDERFLFACTGWNLQSCESTVSSADLVRRVCAVRSTAGAPDCRFQVVGPCWTDATTEPDACIKTPGPVEVFSSCHTVSGSPPSSTGFTQVITVHLTGETGRLSHPDCQLAAPGPPACTHGLCTTGVALPPTCDACARAICDVDQYCCNVAWDSLCVQQVKSVCHCVEGLARGTCDECAAAVQTIPGHAYCASRFDNNCIAEYPNASPPSGITCETCSPR